MDSAISKSENCKFLSIDFTKTQPSFGMFIVGGNRVGHFIHTVSETGLASKVGLLRGDNLHQLSINKKDKTMNIPLRKLTHEEVLLLLKTIPSNAKLTFQIFRPNDPALANKYERKLLESPDCFYVRANFDFFPRDHKISTDALLKEPWFYINKGDIFQVTHTHFKSSDMQWRAIKIFEPNDQKTTQLTKMGTGIIPSNSFGTQDGNLVYERVCLRKPKFRRPVVIFSAFQECIYKFLVAKYPTNFTIVDEDPLGRFTDVEKVQEECERAHSLINLKSIEEIDLFNAVTTIYPICIMVVNRFTDYAERIFSRWGVAIPEPLDRRIELIKKLEAGPEIKRFKVMTIDEEVDDINFWEKNILKIIQNEQRKFVWITHSNNDVFQKLTVIEPEPDKNLEKFENIAN